MMTWTVYHAVHPTFGRGRDPSFPLDYVAVAEVTADEIHEVFGLMNEGDIPSEVTLIGPLHRSTSVGDVVETPNGHVFRVEPFGWTRLR